jgi:glutamyl/glutaminyl-tRNA synthetase
MQAPHTISLTPVPANSQTYRGRLAPSPTGLLHLGHARTFWTAAQRAAQHHGQLILRNEDLDPQRCKPEFVRAMYEDLHWLGIAWTEGPDRGGPFAPYSQSERRPHYLAAWQSLRASGQIYPCTCSRKDVAQSPSAPHENDPDDDPIYPGHCRPISPGDHPTPCGDGRLVRPAEAKPRGTHPNSQESEPISTNPDPTSSDLKGANWRFRVPDGEAVEFTDLHLGPQLLTAGRDFGDFIVWRRDNVPAYQLAVVVDDAAMQITEVVRGADLLKSTVRQILLSRALGLPIPAYYHCDLIRDESGVRLAKRHDALSIRHLREQGCTPEQVRLVK